MDMDENKEFDQELDLVEMTDDEGNTITMQVVDYFFYNGEEYVILADTESATDEDADIDCYVMKVIVSTDEDGEELETFEPIEDAALEAKLIEVANTQLEGDNDAEV